MRSSVHTYPIEHGDLSLEVCYTAVFLGKHLLKAARLVSLAFQLLQQGQQLIIAIKTTSSKLIILWKLSFFCVFKQFFLDISNNIVKRTNFEHCHHNDHLQTIGMNITPDLPYLNIYNPFTNERISVYLDKHSCMSSDTKDYFVKQISHLSKGVVIVTSA